MSQSRKIMPNLDKHSTKLLNLTVLQRRDPSIEEILITATHVTFYEFNIELNQWSRKDVEGSLFVVKRNTQPRFQFIVMNRRNTDNLVENLLGDFEYEIQVPYLLYRNAAQEVNGIWFYNSYECQDVGNLFSRILSAYSKVSPKPKVSSSKSEFEEFEDVPSLGMVERSMEPSVTVSTSTSTDVPEESSLLNFFGRAMNSGHNTSNVMTSGNPYYTSTTAPLSSHLTGFPSPVPPAQEMPSLPLSASSIPPTPVYDPPDPINHINQVTNLVKPSLFFTPPTSSSAFMPAPLSLPMRTATLQPPLNLQSPHGTPLLQPFPPPTPSPSLTPILTPTPFCGLVNRDKVRDAFLVLAQDNQVIDMFYQALLKGHQS